MSRTYHHDKKHRKDEDQPPKRIAKRDYRKLGRMILDLTQAELEAEAKKEYHKKKGKA